MQTKLLWMKQIRCSRSADKLRWLTSRCHRTNETDVHGISLCLLADITLGISIWAKSIILTLKQAVARDKSSHPAYSVAHRPYSGSGFNSLHSVTSTEVLKIISSLPSKSSPLDYIPSSLIKSCCSVFFWGYCNFSQPIIWARHFSN